LKAKTRHSKKQTMESISLLAKVFWSPGETMFKVAKNPKVVAPLLFITLSAIVSVLVMTSYVNMFEMSMRMQEQQGRVQQMTPEQRAQAMQFANNPVFKILTVVAGSVFPTLMVLAIAAIYFGLFTLVGRSGTFKAFVAVTAFAFIPGLVRTIATILTVVIVPQSQIMLDELGSIGPSLMVDRVGMSPKLFAALSQLDVVSIWILSLLVIGYGHLTSKGVSAATRAVCVFGVFLVYVGFRVALA